MTSTSSDDLTLSVSVGSPPPKERICAYPLPQDTPRNSHHLDIRPLEQHVQVAHEHLRRLSWEIRTASAENSSAVSEQVASLLIALAPVRVQAAKLEASTLSALVDRIDSCRQHLQAAEKGSVKLSTAEKDCLDVLHRVFVVALSQHSPQSETDNLPRSAQLADLSSIQNTLQCLAATVDRLSNIQEQLGADMKMYNSNGSSSGTDPSRTAVVTGGNEWSQGRSFSSRELSQSSGNQGMPVGFLDTMDPEQLRAFALQGMLASRQPMVQPTHVTVHNSIAADAAANAAADQQSAQTSHVVTAVRNTIKQARANIWPLLIGAVAAIMLHNHTPILSRISPGGGRRSRQLQERLERERLRTRRTAVAAEDAVEECYEAMREWREYSRRARGPFQHVPEPSASRCDLRALRARIGRSAAGGGEAREAGQGERSDEMEVWRALLRE
eukprot:jgi/Ulvmu1/11637/UM008_0041.1